jgi:hypothetical protein
LDCRIEPDFVFSTYELEKWTERTLKLESNRSQRSSREELVSGMIRVLADDQKKNGLIEELYKTTDDSGILSLSSVPDSVLMWSHYADKHKGIVLKLTASLGILEKTRKPIIPIKVRYCDDYPKIQFFRDDVDTRISGLIGSKAKAWEHEEEWRLVAKGHVGLVSFPPEFVSAIIFGLRTPEAVKAQIRRCTEVRSHAVGYFQMRTKPKSFDLEVVPI